MDGLPTGPDWNPFPEKPFPETVDTAGCPTVVALPKLPDGPDVKEDKPPVVPDGPDEKEVKPPVEPDGNPETVDTAGCWTVALPKVPDGPDVKEVNPVDGPETDCCSKPVETGAWSPETC